jgi:hypothetical protein
LGMSRCQQNAKRKNLKSKSARSLHQQRFPILEPDTNWFPNF